MRLAHNTTMDLSHPSSLTLGHISNSPNIGDKWGNLFILATICCIRGPSKALPEFLVWPLSSVQLLSSVWLFVTPWTAARQASLSITNSWSRLKFMSIESVMQYSNLILCHPFFPPAPNPSQHQNVFQWVHSSHEVAKVLEFQLQRQSFLRIFRTDFL